MRKSMFLPLHRVYMTSDRAKDTPFSEEFYHLLHCHVEKSCASYYVMCIVILLALFQEFYDFWLFRINGKCHK